MRRFANKKCIAALCLLLAVPVVCSLAAVRGKDARYVGGTISAIPANTEGRIELGQDAAVFNAKSGTNLTMPYSKIQSLEYGQKAGRRLGMALVVSPLFLLSHKRRHFLTITFTDEAGKDQGAVFELAKGVVRETLSTLETKTGKKVEYDSDEAQKSAK
ncbi:MAG: hypothetical protein ACRD50_05205 [Candidatus Acidiferrales bacterium]